MIKYINGIKFESFDNASTSSVTGTTANTKILSINVPADTLKGNDLIKLSAICNKVGTAGNWTVRFYWNTSDSLSGAIQLSVRSLGSTSTFFNMTRKMSIRTASGFGSGFSLGTELASTTTGMYNEIRSETTSNVAIDWTVSGYLMLAIQLSNSGDTGYCQGLKLITY